MHHGADAARAQPPHHFGTAHPGCFEIDQHHVEVPRRRASGAAADRGDDRRQRGQSLIIQSGQRAAPRDEAIELAELARGQRAMDVAGPVIEARRCHFVVPRVRVAVGVERQRGVDEPARVAAHPVIARQTQALGGRVVVGGHRAALAHGDSFHRVERERVHAAVAAPAHRMVFIAGDEAAAQGMRRVAHHRQAVFGAQRGDLRHVATLPVEMNRKHRAYLGAAVLLGAIQRRFEIARAHQPAVGIDIGEDDVRAGMMRCVGGGEKGQARHHHAVAGCEVEGERRQVERRGAARTRHRVARADA